MTWEQCLRQKLLPTSAKDDNSLTIEFLRQALIRADIKSRNESYKVAFAGAPYMTVNEVRASENLNRLDDPRADKLLLPTSTFSDVNKEGKLIPPAFSTTNDDEIEKHAK